MNDYDHQQALKLLKDAKFLANQLIFPQTAELVLPVAVQNSTMYCDI